MAQRRMFSLKIVASDSFLDMPVSARELYFQLGMYADDDGFINPKKIVRMTGASDDDLKLLIAKRFILPFENGVVVIKHWLINNLIRKDFYQPTVYLEQREALKIKENKAYTDDNQNVNNLLPQVRLGKDRLHSGIFKKKLPPYKKMIKNIDPDYGDDSPGIIRNEEQAVIEEEKMAKQRSAYLLDADNLLAYYNEKYIKEIGDKVPFGSKARYLKQLKPILARYPLEKLKRLMDNYFYRDDVITRGNNWSMSCFLSTNILIQLENE